MNELPHIISSFLSCMRQNFWSLILFLFFSMLLVSSGHAANAAVNPLKLRLDFAQERTADGTVYPIAILILDPEKGYHSYAHTGENVAMPTLFTVHQGAGALAPVTVLFPKGTQSDDPLNPGKKTWLYEGQTPIFIRMDRSFVDKKLMGRLSLLLCSEKNCVPINQEVPFRLGRTALNDLPDIKKSVFAQQYAAAIPDSSEQTGTSTSLANRPRFNAAGGTLNATTGKAELSVSGVFPDSSIPAPSSAPVTAAALQADPLLPDQSGWHFIPQPFFPALEVYGLSKALLFGLLAGLILNVMPCVLPVMMIKTSALLAVGGLADAQARRSRFRQHNFFFALGIITWFMLLSLFLGLVDMAWGQLFQTQAVVSMLFLLMVALALSLFGVFTLPVVDLKSGTSGNPHSQAYFSGILATLLATPCSGPLLGGVLGWAILQPLPLLMTVCFAVGLGMSLPYLLFTIFPQATVLLPRPGAWLGVLEKFVGFFLLGTAIFLLSILPSSTYIRALIAALAIGLGAWVWGTWGGLAASRIQRAVTGMLVAVLVIFTSMWLLQPPDPEIHWEPFNATEFRQTLGKELIMLEFTADWCPTCKVLEKTTLAPANLGKWVNNYKVRLIRVDMTLQNAENSALLRALGSNSLPFVALFPTGLDSAMPIVLRDVFTSKQLEEALDAAYYKR